MSRILQNISDLFAGLTAPLKAIAGAPAEVGTFDDEASRDAVLVLDASPSMTTTDWKPSRLAGAQKAAKAFVDTLLATDPGARAAVVAYEETSLVVADLQSVQARHQIFAAIDSIRTGSGTNITAGLESADGLLRSARRSRQVILLTDGEHNCGPGPRRVAAGLRTHSILECVGIGGRPSDVDERLLRAIASADEQGRKRYRWIGDTQKLVRHFKKLATGLTRQP